ncbi:GLIPR1-like protein 1 [Episyrphus balteatus]|uniref:GLIPR1-like protein 1 n=1 Tax=Episyrphus balteatus TaxID=286459 RepID=UPI0024852DB0|nr:GLIPR1-like protein 1 [Episyrphus balteatus]
MSRREINTMILGHNGIRNKIAKEWDIANMNILHWSRELEKLSKYFLIDCQVRRDPCDFLVFKDITIGQNVFFSKASPGSRWVGRTIRHWYSQLGYDIKNWDQFREAEKKNISLTEITQMIWPSVEFIGCAAAKMFEGYMVTCYYHPSISKNWNVFSHGKGCTKCSRERLTCSRDFTKLCGLDVPYNIGRGLANQAVIIYLVQFIIVNIFNSF